MGLLLLQPRRKNRQTLVLVLGEGFGGEQVERARIWLAQAAVEDGQVIAQCFTAGRAGDDYHIPPGARFIPCGCLVLV
jgi:hypothetical protein